MSETSLIAGRIETRRLYVFPQMKDYWDWPGLTLGLVVTCESVAKCSGERRESVRFAITSLPGDTDPDHLLNLFRNHWGIENRCHWILDVSMGEDRSRIRRNPAFVSGLRKMALTLLHAIKGKRSIPKTMRSLWKPNALGIELK